MTRKPWDIEALPLAMAVFALGSVLVTIAITGDLLPYHRRGVALGIVGASAEADRVIDPFGAQ